MALDPNIILSGQQQPSFADQYGKAIQLKALVNQGKLQDLQYQQAQQEMQQAQKLRDLYSGNVNPDGTVNMSGLIQGAAQQGLGDKIPAIQKGILDTQKSQADLQKTQGEISSQQFNLLKDKNQLVQHTIASLANNPNLDYQTVRNSIIDLSQKGLIDDSHAVQYIRSIPETSDQGQLKQFVYQAGLQAADAGNRLNALQPHYQDAGGQLVNTNPLVTAAPISKTATPDQLLTDKRMRETGGPTFSNDASDLLATLTAKGGSLPAGFRSKEQQIATLNGLLSKFPNNTHDEIADMIMNGQINFGSNKTATNTAAKQEGKVATAVNELGSFGDQVLQASANVPRSSFVPINQLMQMADSSISDPALLNLKLKLNALNNAYNVLSARGGTDAASRQRVEKLFSSAQGPEAIPALVQGLKDEGAAAQAAAAKASHVGSESQQSAQPTTAADDVTAINWARANPNDPRSAQILQLHGIK